MQERYAAELHIFSCALTRDRRFLVNRTNDGIVPLGFVMRFVRAVAATTLMIVEPLSSRAAEGSFGTHIPLGHPGFGLAVAPPPGNYLASSTLVLRGDIQRGSPLPVVPVTQDISGVFTAVSYTRVLQDKIFGATYGFGAGIPFVHGHTDGLLKLGPTTIEGSDRRGFVGDPSFMPVSMWWSSGNVHVNWSEIVIAPWGDFAKDRLVKGGFNAWSLHSQVAISLFTPDRKLEFGVLGAHVVSARNHETDYRSGQELAVEGVLNAYLTPAFAVGVRGYAMGQNTADTGSAALLGAHKGKALGLGPAIMWRPEMAGGRLSLSATVTHDLVAVQRYKTDALRIHAGWKF